MSICYVCGKEHLSKDEIGITKKLLGKNEKKMYCLSCLAERLEVTGSACDSVNTQISHVLKAIHLDERIAEGTIRISLGKNNSEEEITSIADAIAKIINS